MSTQIGAVGVAIGAVSILAVENVAKGHDPFPQLLLGGVFASGISILAEIDSGFAMGVATLFLVATLILHSGAITNVLTKISGPTKTVSPGNVNQTI